QYGHAAGDRVLAEFGDLSRQAFGNDDFVARYGGDEFAALMAAPTPQHGAEHIQRLMGYVHRANENRREGASFTVSVGLVYARPGDSATALMERADAALYEAKRAGRDRLVLAA